MTILLSSITHFPEISILSPALSTVSAALSGALGTAAEKYRAKQNNKQNFFQLFHSRLYKLFLGNVSYYSFVNILEKQNKV